MARATSSLPVPLSPVITIEVEAGATVRIAAITLCMAGERLHNRSRSQVASPSRGKLRLRVTAFQARPQEMEAIKTGTWAGLWNGTSSATLLNIQGFTRKFHYL